VDHAVAVKYDPTEVMEPAEEVLSAFGGAAFLRKVFDGRAVDEVPNRARDIVANATTLRPGDFAPVPRPYA